MKQMPWWVWLITVVVIVVAFVAGVLMGARGPADTPSTDDGNGSITPTGTVEPTGTPPAEATMQVRVYLARGDRLGALTREVPRSEAVATAAMTALLQGPTAQEQAWGFHSEIPAGTTLRGVTIAGGTARVDLSGSYDDGGGTLSVTMRLAQVVYTLTQFETVERVEFFMDGAKVDVFTGEGVMLDEPSTRADASFEDVLPAIFAEAPTPGAIITSPLRVWGTSNTFEATYAVRVENTAGEMIAEHWSMATSGSGTRGTFDAPITFDVPAAGTMGTVIFFEESAKDGSEINVIEIPVVFGP